MVVETAASFAKYKLMLKDDVSKVREEDVSFIIASASEDVLERLGVPMFSRLVQVEVPYPGQNERCDVFLNSKQFPFPHPEFSSHDTYVECKFFRQGDSGGNKTNRAKPLWNDFRKVIKLSGSLAYSVVLCENDINTVLPLGGKHSAAIRQCFLPESDSKFSLWVEPNFFVSGSTSVLVRSSGRNSKEIKIVKNISANHSP